MNSSFKRLPLQSEEYFEYHFGSKDEVIEKFEKLMANHNWIDVKLNSDFEIEEIL